jgi:hypothetical protein
MGEERTRDSEISRDLPKETTKDANDKRSPHTPCLIAWFERRVIVIRLQIGPVKKGNIGREERERVTVQKGKEEKRETDTHRGREKETISDTIICWVECQMLYTARCGAVLGSAWPVCLHLLNGPGSVVTNFSFSVFSFFVSFLLFRFFILFYFNLLRILKFKISSDFKICTNLQFCSDFQIGSYFKKFQISNLFGF